MFRNFSRGSYRRHASLGARISSKFGIHRTVLQKVLKRWALFNNYNSYLVFLFFSNWSLGVQLCDISSKWSRQDTSTSFRGSIIQTVGTKSKNIFTRRRRANRCDLFREIIINLTRLGPNFRGFPPYRCGNHSNMACLLGYSRLSKIRFCWIVAIFASACIALGLEVYEHRNKFLFLR